MPPILKNGTLPRSRAGSAYSTGGNGGPLIGGTLERGHSRLSVNNAGYANTESFCRAFKQHFSDTGIPFGNHQCDPVFTVIFFPLIDDIREIVS